MFFKLTHLDQFDKELFRPFGFFDSFGPVSQSFVPVHPFHRFGHVIQFDSSGPVWLLDSFNQFVNVAHLNQFVNLTDRTGLSNLLICNYLSISFI